jgi:hypothetical protein
LLRQVRSCASLQTACTNEMTPKRTTSAHKQESALFKREVISAEDPKLFILLVHLYVEHLLERYLNAKLKTTKKLFGKNGLSFEKKLLLIEAMGGFTTQRIDSIRKLNSLRNDCVHRFKYQPTHAELESFGRTLGKHYAKIQQKVGKDHNKCMRQVCAYFCGVLTKEILQAKNHNAKLPV